jgi:type I restriction enzyme M protein
MFYTTDISVTLWVLNKNKKKRKVVLNGISKDYRDRTGEILFVDLRRWGSEYEKMFIQLTPADITRIAGNFHTWQQISHDKEYKNIPEYCYSASTKEIIANNFSLVPSKYIEFVDRDSGINFDKEMKRIQKTFKTILNQESDSQSELKKAFKGLGYEI